MHISSSPLNKHCIQESAPVTEHTGQLDVLALVREEVGQDVEDGTGLVHQLLQAHARRLANVLNRRLSVDGQNCSRSDGCGYVQKGDP